MSRPFPAIRVCVVLALASALVAVVLLVVWKGQRAENVQNLKSDPFVCLNLSDPDCTYLVLRHAVETGGNERTRELAITWLDQQSRRRLPLSAEQENGLLAMIESNGHASWDSEYRFLIFNSAFNVLHMGAHQETFTRLLENLALKAPEKTMRLYALQHIAVQRDIGHLTGLLSDEVRATLHTLASHPRSPVAGTALSTLITWDGRETPADPQLIALALRLAADPACEVDVRVTALHAARESSLPLARQLARDINQPVQLRKAAIASIGWHGEETDRANLQNLRSENFRLAQAAEPAIRLLEKRLSNPQAAAPIPF